MTQDHALGGCTPVPLASYLKALGVLRLVARQKDPEARGFWRKDDVFVLRTVLSKQDLVDFFLHRYVPTPLLAPWNGGSGFYPKDNKKPVDSIQRSTHPRFEDYRQAIGTAQNVLARLGLQKKPEEGEKVRLLQALRNVATDPLLEWMDAAVIIAGGGETFPPLLGTGGNDGRLEFTINFMQRLHDVLDVATGNPKPGAGGLLEAALFAHPSPVLSEGAIGQFAPGSAGGPNATSGDFEAESRLNPWDFVLMLEGVVLFAASAVRRLETSNGAMLSAPFTVQSRLDTEASAAVSDDRRGETRGEVWLPLWGAPLGCTELSALFAEGRATVGARPVRDGLDFARAVARLGVDRGLDAFQRYAFVKRFGRSYLATPFARIPVRRRREADLLDELDKGGWLGSVQSRAIDGEAPQTFRAAVARLDATLFALLRRPGRERLQDVLGQLGRLDTLCALSVRKGEERESRTKSSEGTGRSSCGPVPWLSFAWAAGADDASSEFRIALALAGLATRVKREDGSTVVLGFRHHLVPLRTETSPRSRPRWDPGSPLPCWGSGSLERNLRGMLERRRLEALRGGGEGSVLRSRAGASLTDVVSFLEGTCDERKITVLAAGLACVDVSASFQNVAPPSVLPPPVYVFLKPFFVPEADLREYGFLPPDRGLGLPAALIARLAAGDVDAALALAWSRLRASEIPLPGREPPRATGFAGPRLLAALTIPLDPPSTRRLHDSFTSLCRKEKHHEY